MLADSGRGGAADAGVAGGPAGVLHGTHRAAGLDAAPARRAAPAPRSRRAPVTRTTSPTSSTPPAPPAGPRAWASSTAARSPWSTGRWSVFRRRTSQGVLAATSVCFDLSVLEIFVPLAMGGRVILAPNVLGAAAARGHRRGHPGQRRAVGHGRAGATAGCRAGCARVNLAGEALKRRPRRSGSTPTRRSSAWSTSTAPARTRPTPPGRVGAAGRPAGHHRPAPREQPGAGAGAARRAAAGGRARRAVPRRRRPGPRLPGPAGADRGPLRARSVRPGPARACTAPATWCAAAGRPARLPRPARPPGQAARLPHRAGGDRGGPREPSGGAPGGGRRCAPTARRARGSWPTWCPDATTRRGADRRAAPRTCAARCPGSWCPRPGSSWRRCR